MPAVDRVGVTVATPLAASFRAQQAAGMFGLTMAATVAQTFTVDVPVDDGSWRVGVIVGPSGSGKTTIARHVYGANFVTAAPWPERVSILDGFPEDLTIGAVTSLLTAVGFASPPAWLRPYAVLSNGEKFRCDLARALASARDLIAFDEYTSVVDRTVAKIGSAAVAKAVRRGAQRFVAVTCHYDVIDWLEPDWVLDMATGSLTRSGLWRRPSLELRLRAASPRLWSMFARHHYLNEGRIAAGDCYVAEYEGAAVCFVALRTCRGQPGLRLISRVVTLPDYQGIGIGAATINAVAALTRRRPGVTGVRLVTSHPAMMAALRRHPDWRCASFYRHGCPGRNNYNKQGGLIKTSQGRPVASFAYAPQVEGSAPEKLPVLSPVKRHDGETP